MRNTLWHYSKSAAAYGTYTGSPYAIELYIITYPTIARLRRRVLEANTAYRRSEILEGPRYSTFVSIAILIMTRATWWLRK
jgi:hypothetical protein